MKYVEKTGKVTEVRNGKAVVTLDTSTAASCGLQCSCCIGQSCGPRELRVEAGSHQVGDRVIVDLPRRSVYLSIVLLLLLPMALFVAGALLGGVVAGSQGGPSGGLIGGGAVGLVLAFSIAWLVERRTSAAAPPRVRRVE